MKKMTEREDFIEAKMTELCLSRKEVEDMMDVEEFGDVYKPTEFKIEKRSDFTDDDVDENIVPLDQLTKNKGYFLDIEGKFREVGTVHAEDLLDENDPRFWNEDGTDINEDAIVEAFEEKLAEEEFIRVSADAVEFYHKPSFKQIKALEFYEMAVTPIKVVHYDGTDYSSSNIKSTLMKIRSGKIKSESKEGDGRGWWGDSGRHAKARETGHADFTDDGNSFKTDGPVTKNYILTELARAWEKYIHADDPVERERMHKMYIELLEYAEGFNDFTDDEISLSNLKKHDLEILLKKEKNPEKIKKIKELIKKYETLEKRIKLSEKVDKKLNKSDFTDDSNYPVCNRLISLMDQIYFLVVKREKTLMNELEKMTDAESNRVYNHKFIKEFNIDLLP